MKNNDKQIRDFVYLNVELLYSLYSQVFEGVTEQIVQSYADELSSVDTQKGNPLSGKNIETQVAVASLRTENKLLHDHMYNLLEEKLKNVIMTDPDVSCESYLEFLKIGSFIKIQGDADIEDYDRIKLLFKKYNDIGGAIAYSATQELWSEINEIESYIKSIKDRNRKKVEEKKIETIKKNIENYAVEMGLHLDEKNLENLEMFSEVFGSGRYDITIPLSKGEKDIVFRGILDKKWLRAEPSLMRALYGGITALNWTMVGQITYLPIDRKNREHPEINDNADNQKNERFEVGEEICIDTEIRNNEDENPSIRDPFRKVFRSVGYFENIFHESKERIEIILNPIAIYREITLPPLS
jgi:hypothetical protein